MHPLEKKVILKKPTLGKIFFKRSLLCDYLICLFEMPSSQAHSKLTCVWRVLTWAAPLAVQVLALLEVCEQVVVRRYPREAVPFKVCFLNHKWALDLEEKKSQIPKGPCSAMNQQTYSLGSHIYSLQSDWDNRKWYPLNQQTNKTSSPLRLIASPSLHRRLAYVQLLSPPSPNNHLTRPQCVRLMCSVSCLGRDVEIVSKSEWEHWRWSWETYYFISGRFAHQGVHSEA